ncbi:MAG: RHS repeat-associated core domain-containing protein [Waddliaceae bacterium]
MQLQFIFTLLLFPLFILAETPLLDHDPTSSYIFETVNVITGDYCEKQTDLFSICRHSSDLKSSGWVFNLPNFPFKEHEASESEQYSFDDEGRLNQVKQENGETLFIHYQGDSCRIESKSGDWIEYRFLPSSPARLTKGVYIQSIISSKGMNIKYEYTPHPKERKLLISKQIKSDRETMRVEYDASGKVKTLLSQEGGLFEFTYSMGVTEVLNGLRNKTIYHHDNYQLTRIEEYLNENPYRVTRLFYDSHRRIISKTKEESGGQILQCQTFAYDKTGRVIAKGLYGNLSGECKAPLKLQNNGMPQENGIECNLIKFRYSQKAPFALQTIFYPNGSRMDFQYENKTLRKTAQFLTTPDHLTIRQFYLYDEKGNLCEEIIDDGRCKQRENLSGVHERKITRYSDGQIEYLYLDPSTQEEVLASRVLSTYSENGECIQREIFNRNLERISGETNTYDQCGRLIRKETNHGIEEAEYDPFGNLVYQSNEKGTSEYIYDQNHRLIMQEETSVSGETRSAQYRYDDLGRQIGSCDSNGNWTTFTLDSLGRKTVIVHPLVKSGVPKTHLKYNIFDQVTKKIDAEGRETSIAYNARGQPTKFLYPDGSEETYIYNLDGTKKKATARSGLYTLYSYDALGRVSDETLYSSDDKVLDGYHIESTAFHPLQKIRLDGKQTHFFYDGCGRETAIINGESKVELTYNPSGDIETKKEWFGPGENDFFLNCFHYDQERRLILSKIGDASGVIRQENKKAPEMDAPALKKDLNHINDRGQTVSKKVIVKKNGSSQTLIYDAMNQLETIITRDPLGNEVSRLSFLYDLVGNKIEERADSRPSIVWQYDSMDRLIAQIEEGSASYYSYRKDGLLCKMTQPNGVHINYEYNDLGAITALYSSDRSVDYAVTYNSYNQPIQMTDRLSGEVTTRCYDTDGRLIEEIFPCGAKMQYRYDLLGRRIGAILPDRSKIQYTYDTCQLKTVTRQNPEGEALYFQDFFYDTQGKLTHTDCPKLHGTVHYAYDEMGRICAVDSEHYSQSLKRDEEGQVTYIKTNEKEECISYCPSGEIENKPMDCLKRLFDANGNLIEEEGRLYFYDAMGRLTKVIIDEKETIHYSYDFLGRRLSKTFGSEKEFYLYDDMHDIATLNEHGEQIHFRLLIPQAGAELAIAFESAQNSFGVINTLFHSIGCIIDSTKEISETYEYTPFKQENSARLIPWRYKSKRVDPHTQLIFFGKRDYAPHLGQWTTKDPLGHIDSLNRYCFCLNNPLNYNDLFGGFTFSDGWHALWNGTQYIYDSIQRSMNVFRDKFGYMENMRTEFDELAKGVFGSGVLHLSGYFQDISEAGIFGKGELNEKVRITLVNGIMNARLDYKNNLAILGDLHGGMNIHYIFDSSSGWTHDIVKAILLKAGYVTNEAKLLARTWKKLIKQMGGVDGGGLIIHYAHSLGGCVTQTASHLLTAEEKRMIRVITVASASFFQDSDFESLTHYISCRDIAYVLSPYESIRSFFNTKGNIQWVGSFNEGFPLIDHFILGHTYYEVFRMLSQEFQETYLN